MFNPIARAVLLAFHTEKVMSMAELASSHVLEPETMVAATGIRW